MRCLLPGAPLRKKAVRVVPLSMAPKIAPKGYGNYAHHKSDGLLKAILAIFCLSETF